MLISTYNDLSFYAAAFAVLRYEKLFLLNCSRYKTTWKKLPSKDSSNRWRILTKSVSLIGIYEALMCVKYGKDPGFPSEVATVTRIFLNI